MFRHKIVAILVVSFILVDITAALYCFSCYGNGGESDCENYLTYENALKESEEKRRENKILKNCTAPFNEICYIETYYEKGEVISHIRDCGDGKTFTFNNDEEKEPYYNRLRSMIPNNETVCVFDLTYMVCLSMCNGDDFCNGPSEAVGLGYSNFLLTFACIVVGVWYQMIKESVFWA